MIKQGLVGPQKEIVSNTISSNIETAYGRLERCINQWYGGGPNPISELLFVLPIQRGQKENKTKLKARQKNRGEREEGKRKNDTSSSKFRTSHITYHISKEVRNHTSPVYLSLQQQSCPKQIANVVDLASALFLRKYGPIQRPFSRYRHELC